MLLRSQQYTAPGIDAPVNLICVRNKDDAKQKKLGGDHGGSKEAQEEAEKRLKLLDGDRTQVKWDDLREFSRRKYLEKREGQKVQALDDDIRDNEYLFGDAALTKREAQELEFNKTILNLANEKRNIKDDYDGYQIPQSLQEGEGRQEAQQEELYQRYVEEVWEESEQQQLERLQARILGALYCRGCGGLSLSA